jgi:F-type H+-transporting ATPase subunit b
MFAQSPTENTTTGTTAPDQGASGGFPPFKVETYPSQIFWLVICFVFLLAMMWRVAVPKIGGVIAERKGRIASELAKAEEGRKQAERAAAAYQAPILEARERAKAVSEATRAEMAKEVERAKASADAETAKANTEALQRIGALQAEAKRHISAAAEDAVVEIVTRLTGENISREEAAAAVRDTVKA